MAEIEIQITGAKELAQRFALLADAAATTVLQEATTAAALVVSNQAKILAPKRSTNLARSIHLEQGPASRSEATVLVGTDLEYARAVEFGSGMFATRAAPRMILIRPKTKKALFWAGAAHPVKLVRSPGIKPQPYLIPALRDHQDEVKTEFEGAFRDLLEHV